MNTTLAAEFARLADEIEESPRNDLQDLLDFISAACMLASGLDEIPEVVRFMRAIGGKLGKTMDELRHLEPLVRTKISDHAGDEVGRIWGNPSLVSRGS